MLEIALPMLLQKILNPCFKKLRSRKENEEWERNTATGSIHLRKTIISRLKQSSHSKKHTEKNIPQLAGKAKHRKKTMERLASSSSSIKLINI